MSKHEIIYNVEQYQDMKSIINSVVKRYPDNIAFTLKKENGKYEDISYKKFKEDMVAFGTALIKMGYKNKRIAIIGKNSYEWALAYLSTLCGIGTVVPLDKGLPEQEIKSLLKRSKTDVLVFEDKYIDIVSNIKDNANNNVRKFICTEKTESGDFEYIYDLIEEGNKLISKGFNEYENVVIDLDETRIILFTSGTTSMSKAVMLSNRNLASNICGLNSVQKLFDTDVFLALLPFHHTLGSIGLLVLLSNGAKTVFCDGIRYIKQNLSEYKVTVFLSVPLIIESMYKKIQEEIDKKSTKNIIKAIIKISKFLPNSIKRKIFKDVINGLGGKIRLVINGGAAIDKKALEGFLAFGITTLQGYGLTETSPILSLENDSHIRSGSVGFSLPNVDIKIDNPNENGIGEILARGPNIMSGYYENEEATNEVLKNGWFYTGDLGRFDKDGYIYITGRKKNVIVLKNGKNVYPEELEVELSNIPYLLEALVYDIEDKDGDSILAAKIVYNKTYIEEKYEGISKEEIENIIWEEIKKFNKTMAIYKHIKKIIVTDEPMEKTTSNKIKRFQEIAKIKGHNERTSGT